MLIYLQMIETEEERDVFTQIYTKYHNMLFQIALDILRNNEDAEDAVHKVFLKIAEGKSTLLSDPVSSRTKSLLITMTEQASIDIYRKNKRNNALNDTLALDGIAFVYPEDHSLAYCISKLPPRYRSLIILKYHHGLDQQALSEVFGISGGSLRMLESRARAALYELCCEEGLL